MVGGVPFSKLNLAGGREKNEMQRERGREGGEREVRMQREEKNTHTSTFLK